MSVSLTLEKCPYGGYSCIACMLGNKKQYRECYPLMGQNPPNPKRFLHKDQLAKERSS
ncbi:Uncharacterised protein [uncultured archaeon]|nr:Uncharacterised protein [uncultured archaeon]